MVFSFFYNFVRIYNHWYCFVDSELNFKDRFIYNCINYEIFPIKNCRSILDRMKLKDYYYLMTTGRNPFLWQTNATEEGRASTSWTMVESKTHCKGRRVWWRSCYYVSRWFVSFRYGYCWRNINALSTRYTGQYEQIIAFANESGLLNVNKIHSTIRFFLLDTCHPLKKIPSILQR